MDATGNLGADGVLQVYYKPAQITQREVIYFSQALTVQVYQNREI